MASEQPPDIPPVPDLGPIRFSPAQQPDPIAEQNPVAVPGADYVETLDAVLADPEPEQPEPRGLPLLAWFFIIAAVGFILTGPTIINLLQSLKILPLPKADGPAMPTLGIPEIQARVLARYVVGTSQMLAPDQRAQLLDQLQVLKQGTFQQRLTYAIIVGEVQGPEAAETELRKLRLEAWAPQEDQRLVDILRTNYEAIRKREKPALAEEDKALVSAKLGWAGNLALTPASAPPEERQAVLAPAKRTVIGVFAIAGGGCCGGITSLALATLFIVFLSMGKLTSHGEPTGTGHGGIYAETFALWILFHVGFTSIAVPFFGEKYHLLISGTVMLLSLSTLVWPVLRGVAWAQVRRDIGLVSGPSPFLEPFYGLASYLAFLPMTALALLFMLIMMRLSGAAVFGMYLPLAANPGPSHPAVGWLVEGDWSVKLQVLFLAVIVAPLVEEIVFRGLLYRHLREATRHWPTAASIIVSGLTVSFIFAVIHPQGPIAVPALMSLALAFTFARVARHLGRVDDGPCVQQRYANAVGHPVADVSDFIEPILYGGFYKELSKPAPAPVV